MVVFFVLFSFKNILSVASSLVTIPFVEIREYMHTSSASFPVYVRDRTDLRNTIQSLEQQLAAQEGMRTTLAYIEHENAELRALLGADDTPSILAGVIARPPYSPYDTMVIDRGAEDGVKENAPVYYGSGMALGYVRKVFEKHALITLVSSPEVESTVYVFGANIFTTAYGEGGGVVRLSVPQGVPVAVGDVVAFPSLSGGVIGSVSTVQSIPSEPEQHAYVVLEIPMQSIRVVRVGAEPLIPPQIEDVREHVEVLKERIFITPIPASFEVSSSTSSTTHESV